MFILLVASGIMLDATQVNLFIVTGILMVLEENTLQSHQVHAVWRLLLRLTLSTDVCNIDMGTQIRMGKIIFNKE